MTELPDFAKLVPGFDFLKGLAKQAGGTLPSLGQWIAPTVDPEELDKRIEQLKTVQFWLEQNARMLGATVQALEVQRMTLSTLKSMKLPVDQIGQALQMPMGMMPGMAGMAGMPGMPPMTPAAPADDAADEPAPPPDPAPRRASARAGAAKSRAASKASSKPAAGVDPAAGAEAMQWWGALTQQFSELASRTLKDLASDARSASAQAAPAAKPAAARKRAAPRKTAPKKTARKPAARKGR